MLNRSSHRLLVTAASFAVMFGVALGQGWAGAPAADAQPAAAQDAPQEKVVIKTYNISDLARTTRDYPFESAMVPPTHVNAPAAGPRLSGGGGGGGGGGDPAVAAPGAPFAGAGGRQTPPMGGIGLPYDEMVDAVTHFIMDSVAPDTWRDAGGSVGMIKVMGNLVIIHQTEAAHKQIVALLNELRKEAVPTRMVTVRAVWLMLDPEAAGALSDQAKGGNLDVAGLVRQAGKGNHYRAQTTCFNGQTVHVASGRGRTVVTGLEPAVGTAVGLYDVRTTIVQAGAMLEVTPALTPDGKAAVLDLSSVVSNWEGPVPAAGGGGAATRPAATLGVGAPGGSRVIERGMSIPPGTGATEVPPVDRINVTAQQLRTTLRVPLGKPILVGGMTMEPSAGEGDGRQLYLIVEVTASEEG